MTWRGAARLACAAAALLPLAWANAAARDGTAVDLGALSPADLMARYQARCAGITAEGLDAADASAAFAHGMRCDALREAIQDVDPGKRHVGGADLARPDFYTPGVRAR